MRRQSHPNFGFADNFEKTNKPNCCGLAIWLILLVIRLEPLNSNAVWWVSASYQPIGRVTHLSITLILQCSAQDCKSCNAKLQNLFQSPISQTVKNAWSHDAWGHGFKSYFTIFSVAIVTTLNFGNKSILLPKLSWTKIKCILILIQKSAIITAFLQKKLSLKSDKTGLNGVSKTSHHNVE